MTIAENINAIRLRIAGAAARAGRPPGDITLVAVTKNQPAEAIEAAFRAGVGHFGENRVQEAESKITQLAHLTPKPTWRLVGHLQTNKVKPVLELFDAIDSVDSLRLAQALSRQSTSPLPILIEVNVAGETSKHGFSPAGLMPALEQIRLLPNLQVEGLMTVAPATGSPEEVRPVFRTLAQLARSAGLKQLSMGMSDDFEVAIEEGATLVRIGRSIFGERA